MEPINSGKKIDDELFLMGRRITALESNIIPKIDTITKIVTNTQNVLTYIIYGTAFGAILNFMIRKISE